MERIFSSLTRIPGTDFVALLNLGGGIFMSLLKVLVNYMYR